MNIFSLDPYPEISASWHCDVHLHKMILESAQLLSTLNLPFYPKYKPAYINHPCAIWVREDLNNARWLVELALFLESTRFNYLNAPQHSSTSVILRARDFLGPLMDFQMPTRFPEAMPAHIKMFHRLSTHEKYRKYYIYKAKLWKAEGRPMTFKNRNPPPWMPLEHL